MKLTYPEFADTVRAMTLDGDTQEAQTEALIPDAHERALFKQAFDGLMQDLANAIDHLGS